MCSMVEYDNNSLHELFATNGIQFRFSCPRRSQQNGKSERMIRTINNVVRSLLFQARLSPEYWVEALLTPLTYLISSPPPPSTMTSLTQTYLTNQPLTPTFARSDAFVTLTPFHHINLPLAPHHLSFSETVYMHQPPGFTDSAHSDYVCLLQKSLYGLKQAPKLGFNDFLAIFFYFTPAAYHLFTTCGVCYDKPWPTQLFSRTPIDTEKKLGPEGSPVTDPTLYRSLAGSLQYLTFTRPDLSYAVQQLCLYMHDPREPHLNAMKRDVRPKRRSTSGYCVFLGDNLLTWSSKRQGTLSRSSAEAKYRWVANVVAETTWIRNLLRELHTPLFTVTLVYCDNASAVYMSANPVQHQRTKHIEIGINFVRDKVAAGHVRVLYVPSGFSTQISSQKPNPHFHGLMSSISPIPKSHSVALSDPHWRDAMHDEYNALIKNSTWVLAPKPPNANVVRSMWLFRHKYHANGSLTLVLFQKRFDGHALKVGFSASRCDSSLFIYRHDTDIAYLLIYVDDIILTASSTDLLQRIISLLHKEFDKTDLGALNYFLGISVTRDSTGISQAYYAYVQGTLNFGLQLYSSPSSSLVAYTDADWAGFPTTRRSTSGYCVFLGDNLLSWSAKRQHTLSRSNVEAEYRGVANVVAEAAWIRNLLPELHSPIHSATIVYCDNVSAIYLTTNPVQHLRTKHIEIDIHFVRDMVARGQVRVLHVPSRYQYADIFTKGLPTTLFEEFRTSLSVRPPPARTAGKCHEFPYSGSNVPNLVMKLEDGCGRVNNDGIFQEQEA
ncbi:ribonuclease H-like domain-containing protein [Tanacetum coccineum]